jgi:transketolase
MTVEELKNFRQLHSRTPGHPEYGHAPGIETTTGPLGQGLGNAVGMALAERLLNARHGDEIVSHYTYCVVGDGCLMEGLSHEAISLAGHLKLGRLIVLFDDNQVSIDGPTSLAVSDDQIERFRASNWHTARVDSHDPEAIALAIENAKSVTDRPSLIACRTIIGQARRARRAPPQPTALRLGQRRLWARARSSIGGILPSRCRSRSWPAGARRAPGIARPTRLGPRPRSGSMRQPEPGSPILSTTR